MKTKRNRTFSIIVEKDESGFYVATNTALLGCYSQGKTVEEALKNVREATTLCLADKSNKNRRGNTEVEISVHLITT